MNDMTRPENTPPAERSTNFPAMLREFLPEIRRALPKHMDGDRMARIALTAFRSTPALKKCDPVSVFAAVIQSSQLGLEVGLMGEAHLVPFNSRDGGSKCQLIPGYQGLMKLARNSGLITDIYAHEVRERDHFKCTFGLERTLEHEPLVEHGFPASDEARGEIVGFYAVALFKDGAKAFVAMSRHEVEKIRDHSKGYIAAKKYKKESLWDTDFLSMGLKTAIRRLCKFLPKSPELAAALALDSLNERGKEQHLDVDKVIDGDWAPTTEDEDEDKPATPTLPGIEDEKFAKDLAGWKKLIAKGKDPEEIIAMVSSKNTLTAEQLAQIRAADERPAPAEAVTLMRTRAEAAAIGTTDIAKYLGVANLDRLTVSQVNRALAFIANPTGA